MLAELKYNVFEALLLRYQSRTSTVDVPELWISIHSPPGHVASSAPFGFGSASLRQMSPLQASERAEVKSMVSVSFRVDTPIGSVVESTIKRARPKERSTRFMVPPTNCGLSLRGYHFPLNSHGVGIARLRGNRRYPRGSRTVDT